MLRSNCMGRSSTICACTSVEVHSGGVTRGSRVLQATRDQSTMCTIVHAFGSARSDDDQPISRLLTNPNSVVRHILERKRDNVERRKLISTGVGPIPNAGGSSHEAHPLGPRGRTMDHCANLCISGLPINHGDQSELYTWSALERLKKS